MQTNGRLMRDPNQDKLKSKTLPSSSSSFNEDDGPKLGDNKFRNLNMQRPKSGTVIMNKNPESKLKLV